MPPWGPKYPLSSRRAENYGGWLLSERHIFLLYVQTATVPLTDCLDGGSYHGPRWRMEPGDLFIPIDSIEEEATLTCDAKGNPPPQYRYKMKSHKRCLHAWTLLLYMSRPCSIFGLSHTLRRLIFTLLRTCIFHTVPAGLRIVQKINFTSVRQSLPHIQRMQLLQTDKPYLSHVPLVPVSL